MLETGEVPDFYSDVSKALIFIIHRLHETKTDKKLSKLEKACCIFLLVMKKNYEKYRLYFHAILIVALACHKSFNFKSLEYARILSTYSLFIEPKWDSENFLNEKTPKEIVEYQKNVLKKQNIQLFNPAEIFNFGELKIENEMSNALSFYDHKGNVFFEFLQKDKKVKKMTIMNNSDDKNFYHDFFKQNDKNIANCNEDVWQSSFQKRIFIDE